MEKEKESHKIQLNKITIISACTDGYARLTRLIGRLVKHQPYRNLTSRILTRSFAQNLQQAKMGQNTRLYNLPSYVEQTRLCCLYNFLLSNNAITCTYMHGPSLQIARVVLYL